MKKLFILSIFVFSNTHPLAISAADSGYSVHISPTNLVIGEEFKVNWTVPLFSITLDDWFGVFAIGSPNNQRIFWKTAAFRGGDTVFDAPENAGRYEVRYFEVNILRLNSILVAVSETMRVNEPVDDPSTIRNFPPPRGAIIAFGDSLVAGKGASPGNDFPSLLGKALGTPVLNKGVTGNTTAQALARIHRDVFEQNPRIVIVLIGGNDILQNENADQTIQNLQTIIDGIHARGSVVILVGVQGGLFTDRLRDGLHMLWEKTGAAFVPNILRGIIGNPLLSSDTVHPNDAGYRVVAERILPALKKLDAPSANHLSSLAIKKLAAGDLLVSWQEWTNQFTLMGSMNIVSPFFPIKTNVVRANGSARITVKNNTALQQFFFLKKTSVVE